MRYVELLRHPDNDGDSLSLDGVAAAEEIGRTSLHPPYAFFASTGAARAVQTAEILRHAAGQDELPILTVNELFLHTQPAHLQKLMGAPLDGEERNAARARYLRTRLREDGPHAH